MLTLLPTVHTHWGSAELRGDVSCGSSHLLSPEVSAITRSPFWAAVSENSVCVTLRNCLFTYISVYLHNLLCFQCWSEDAPTGPQDSLGESIPQTTPLLMGVGTSQGQNE